MTELKTYQEAGLGLLFWVKDSLQILSFKCFGSDYARGDKIQ